MKERNKSLNTFCSKKVLKMNHTIINIYDDELTIQSAFN